MTPEEKTEEQLEHEIARRLSGKSKHKARPSLSAMQRAQAQHDAFCWTVRQHFSDPVLLAECVATWWRQTLGVSTPLPTGDVRFNDVYMLIRYELLTQGYAAQGLEVPAVVAQRHKACAKLLTNRAQALREMPQTTKKLFDYEDSSAIGQIIINFTQCDNDGGHEMATKKKTKKAAAKKTAAKNSAEKKPRKESATKYAIELLMQEKYTDEQIADMIHKKFPAYGFYKRAATFYRMRLKHGDIKGIGAVEIKKVG